MKYKKPEIIAYVDGKRICRVIETALAKHMLVSDLKKKLRDENKGHEVIFVIER